MKIKTEKQFNLSFNKELEQIPEISHIKFIENEIKEVEKYLEPKEFTGRLDKKYKYANLNLNINHVFRINIKNQYKNDFINAFHDFNLIQKIGESENLEKQITILLACEFSKHYCWLVELKEKLSHKPKQKESN